ncbi:hypothetical protein GCM10010124_39300 [Pilimelia terevasa]|uniref:CsbD-like domain-containing protein n=2 Tax=Pilimelia terevasa TaxID=53372 RepID=A0A8J3FLG9_9ACTN|nr:hypothetical protein GCM10010124_39300 [Pilimelia terevasa]
MGITDRMGDKAEELKGAAKEKIGEVSGDRSMQAEGMAEKVKGKTGQAVEDIKDMARGRDESR